MRRLGILVLTATISLLATATPAWAHTTVKSSVPAANSVVPAPPAAVTLTFSERLSILPTVAVKDAAGTVVNSGVATLDGSVVTQPVKATSTGKYTVEWQATAQDGDKSKGSFAFTLTGGAPSASVDPASPSAGSTVDAPSPPQAATTSSAAPVATADTEDGGTAWWVWALPVIVVVALVATFLVVLRRRAQPEAGPPGQD
jgi:methionine-rich copper-binding protein CopC